MARRSDPYESSFTPSQPKRAFSAKLGRVAFEPVPEPWGPLPAKLAFTTSTLSKRRGPATLAMSVAAVSRDDGTHVLEDRVARDFSHAFLEGAQEPWTYQSTLQPAGAVGAIASVWWLRYQSSGGLSPVNSTSLSSFDAATGRQVWLREILGESLLAEVTSRVRDALGQSEQGDLFEHPQALLAALISESFRPGTAPGTFVVAVPAAIRAAFGTVAEVVVTGPKIPSLHPEK